MRIVLCFFALVLAVSANSSGLVTEFSWKYVDFVWKSEEHKQDYIRKGLYDYKNILLIDVDRARDGRTFVTLIREPGVPASVNVISNQINDSGPLLKPYPNWSWYENNENCQGIISAVRIAIDKCNRLWVLDDGAIDGKRVCPAQLLSFDLNTDKLLNRVIIPNDVSENAQGTSFLVNPIVETHGKRCEQTSVYMTDMRGFGLVVWNGGKPFRIEANVQKPEIEHADITITNVTFRLNDGVMGMALSPRQRNGNHYLFFRPLASLSIYAANTKDLQRPRDGNTINFFKGTDVLPSQSTTMAISQDGILFYALTKEIAIGAYNISTPMTPENFKIALTDEERLQFVSGMKVLRDTKGEEQLYVTSIRLQKKKDKSMNYNEINTRISRVPVKTLTGVSNCFDNSNGNNHQNGYGNNHHNGYGNSHQNGYGHGSSQGNGSGKK